MGTWWSALGGEERDWFIMAGFLTLFVAGIVVGIMGCTVLAALTPLSHLGFGTAVASLLATFITSMIRLT